MALGRGQIDEDGMRAICVQVQPKRAPSLDINTVARLMLKIAIRVNAPKFSILRSGGNQWINFTFATKAPRRIWNELQTGALKHHPLGTALRRSVIVTAEGVGQLPAPLSLDDQERLDRIDQAEF